MEWISVKDKLPQENQFCIITEGSNMSTYVARYRPDYEEYSSQKYYHKPWYLTIGTCLDEVENITHWMPLPELPK